MDFTIRKYRELVRAFVESGYQITTVCQYLETRPAGKVLVLRHDVDEQPQNALKMAEAEKELGVNATYYFRRVSKSDHPDIIRRSPLHYVASYLQMTPETLSRVRAAYEANKS